MKKDALHIPIRIGGISDGIHEFALRAVPAEIGLPEEFAEDIDVQVHLDKTPSQLILKVGIASAAVFPCDRCLAPVRIPFHEEFILFYSRDFASAKQLDEEDVRVIEPDVPVIDIGDDVRDFALISIPMRRTCGENADGTPACKSDALQERLNESAGTIDPRWERLKSLTENHENN